MEASLSLVQQQNLSLTPQLRQSLEVLQMSVLELNQYVQEQIVDNPFLELEYPEAMWNKDDVNSKTFSREVDHDWWLNSSHFTEKSLEQILHEQLEWMHLDKKTFDLCSFIIGNLDDRGYLEVTKELLAQYKQITLEKIKEALQIVQSLEPSGIAASSLEECLLIQLDHQKEQNELVRKLVSHDLQDIAKGKMVQLAKRYQVEVADIRQAVEQISQLNPKPGLLYGKDKTEFVIPDVVLKKEINRYEVIVEEKSMPNFNWNPYYIDMMKQASSGEVIGYLKNKRMTARWMTHCIEQRKITLQKVAEVIFEFQKLFCDLGPSSIKPMSMKQVAGILNVHESTVSRAVSNKYVITPWGLFTLKHFFSASIQQDFGETASSIQIKEKIRDMIKKEDKTDPLSDQKMMESLLAEGIRISRRTVAKYREQMNILTATQRRRFE